jgi:hypothetical protein
MVAIRSIFFNQWSDGQEAAPVAPIKFKILACIWNDYSDYAARL